METNVNGNFWHHREVYVGTKSDIADLMIKINYFNLKKNCKQPVNGRAYHITNQIHIWSV